MVQRHPNGNLSWPQDGSEVTVVKEDSAMYVPALETEDMQISAHNANRAAQDAYMQDLENAQLNVDASRPINGIPAKPVYITVTDPHLDGTAVTRGVKSEGPWPDPPGLPDLKHKMIYPSGGLPPIEEPFQMA